MGILLIGVAIGIIFGSAISLLLAAVVRKLVRDGKVAVFHHRRNTGEVTLNWQKVKGGSPTMKIDGQSAKPLLAPDFRFTFLGRPAFMIDTKTGEPFQIGPNVDPERLWPNAYDRLKAHVGVREEKAANSSNPDALNWAKIGAIAGGVSVLLVFIVLVVIWQTVGGLA